ncbi:MAG: VanZ family protein [Chitinophagaceae bacterium]
MQFSRIFFILACLHAVLATYVLLMPGNDIPNWDWFDKIYGDKWVHAIIFASGYIAWYLASVENSKGKYPTFNTKMFIVLALLSYGIAIEFIQKWMELYRSFAISDMLADTIGIIIGIFTSRWWVVLYKKIGPDGNQGLNQN